MKTPEKLSVLLIDDDELQLSTMKKILNELGIGQVYTARDGEEAFQFLEDMDKIDDMDSRVDVVLCDWDMPNMDGLELLKCVRYKYPDLYFVMITAHRDIRFVQNAVSFDVDAFLCKPFTPQQLQDKIWAR
jgi:YesN/AraC family two-component response regulator